MCRMRWIVIGFAAGAGAAFAVGLLRKRRLVLQTGYLPPEPASGPEAVTEGSPTAAAEPDAVG